MGEQAIRILHKFFSAIGLRKLISRGQLEVDKTYRTSVDEYLCRGRCHWVAVIGQCFL